MRTASWFVYFWGYLVGAMPLLKKAQRLEAAGDLKERDAIVVPKVRHWAGSLLDKAHVQVKVEGLENIPREPVVFVSNHQSYFDIPILLACLDKAHPLLSKVEITKIPLIRSWMKLLGCVFLDRDNVRQSVAALNEAGDLLKQGYCVTIFPEGTRSKGEQIGSFKSGAFKVAFKAKAKLVPVVMDGSYHAFEEAGNRIRPAQVTLRVLPPVATATLSREEQKKLPEEIEALIRSAKNGDAPLSEAAGA